MHGLGVLGQPASPTELNQVAGGLLNWQGGLLLSALASQGIMKSSAAGFDWNKGVSQEAVQIWPFG